MGKPIFIVFPAWIWAVFLFLASLAFPASACNRYPFDPLEQVKLALFKSIIEIVSNNNCYGLEICNLEIKFDRNKIELQDTTYAVFPYMESIELGIPEDILEELGQQLSVKNWRSLPQSFEWEFYEYSPADHTGLVALWYNSTTDKVLYLAKPAVHCESAQRDDRQTPCSTFK